MEDHSNLNITAYECGNSLSSTFIYKNGGEIAHLMLPPLVSTTHRKVSVISSTTPPLYMPFQHPATPPLQNEVSRQNQVALGVFQNFQNVSSQNGHLLPMNPVCNSQFSTINRVNPLFRNQRNSRNPSFTSWKLALTPDDFSEKVSSSLLREEPDLPNGGIGQSVGHQQQPVFRKRPIYSILSEKVQEKVTKRPCIDFDEDFDGFYKAYILNSIETSNGRSSKDFICTSDNSKKLQMEQESSSHKELWTIDQKAKFLELLRNIINSGSTEFKAEEIAKELNIAFDINRTGEGVRTFYYRNIKKSLPDCFFRTSSLKVVFYHKKIEFYEKILGIDSKIEWKLQKTALMKNMASF